MPFNTDSRIFDKNRSKETLNKTEDLRIPTYEEEIRSRLYTAIDLFMTDLPDEISKDVYNLSVDDKFNMSFINDFITTGNFDPDTGKPF